MHRVNYISGLSTASSTKHVPHPTFDESIARFLTISARYLNLSIERLNKPTSQILTASKSA